MNEEEMLRGIIRATEPLRLHANLSEQLAKAFQPPSWPTALIEGAARMAAFDDINRSARALASIAKPAFPDLSKVTMLSSALATDQHFRKMLDDMESATRSSRAMLDGLDNLTERLAPLRLESHFARQLELSAVTQAALTLATTDKFAKLFDMPKTDFGIASSLGGMIDAYRGWVEDVAVQPITWVNVPSACMVFPPIEVFNEADVLVAVDEADQSEEIRVERSRIRSEITSDSESNREALRNRGCGDLIPLLEGARDAILRNGPDHVRHAVTSLREAVTHLMHRLAPDDELRAWSKSEHDFDKGRPTRRARLRYIYRAVDSGPFGEFVVKDVDAVLALFDVFQQGTHGISSDIAQQKLSALLVRVNYVIHFLIMLDTEGK